MRGPSNSKSIHSSFLIPCILDPPAWQGGQPVCSGGLAWSHLLSPKQCLSLEFLNTNLHESGWTFRHHLNGLLYLASGCTPKDSICLTPKGMSDSISLFFPACFILLQSSLAILQDPSLWSAWFLFLWSSFHFLRYKPVQVNLDLGLNKEKEDFWSSKIHVTRKRQMWDLWVQGSCDCGL